MALRRSDGSEMMTPLAGRRRALLVAVTMAAWLSTLRADADPKPDSRGTAKVDAQQDSKPQAAIDPRAQEVLDRAIAYMRKLPAFGIAADVTRDDIVHDDFKVQRNATVELTVRRPDRMRATVLGSEGERLFVYDGKTLSIYAREENYYAAMPAPKTLRETLDAAAEKHDVEMPLLDTIYVAMGGDLQTPITAAGVIGPSRIDGVDCDQLAFRSANVDWQLWIERGAQPLPRKIVITTKDETGWPQYSARMRWDLSAKSGEEMFTFTPPPGALPIAFARNPDGGAPMTGRAQEDSKTTK